MNKEKDKKARENLKELSPVLNELWENLSTTENEDLQLVEKENKTTQSKKKNVKKEKVNETEEPTKETTEENVSETSQKESRAKKFADFDFNQFYNVGEFIYAIKIHTKTHSKVLVPTVNAKDKHSDLLKIRSIWPDTLIACHTKTGLCEVFGPESKDLIFKNLYEAQEYFNSLDLIDESKIKKVKESDIKIIESGDEEADLELANQTQSLEEACNEQED